MPLLSRAIVRAALLAPLVTSGLQACASAPHVPSPHRPLRPDTLEHNGWDREFDLLHLALDLAIDFEERRVDGTATNWVRALANDTRRVRLNAVGLAVRSVTDSTGRTLEFRLDEPWLYIELAEPLARGAEETLAVEYSCSPSRGLYFVEGSKHAEGFAPQVWSQGQDEDNRYWIPTWDYPNDRATYEARLRVDNDMTALSNGALVQVQDHGDGERTFHWRMDEDQVTYLVAVAAGRWEHYEDEWRGVPVDYYVAPGSGEERARRAFGETPEMMEFFSELLDYPYPYPKYAQVAVAQYVWGGMENTTLTVLNDYLIGDEGEVGDLDGDPRLLVAHELAHQWFGDLVTCLGWSHLWLNEAWASYLELLFQGHVSGDQTFRLWLERYREWYLARGGEASVPVALDWFTQGAGERANHVYTKGPWILHMIRRELGDDSFWHGVRSYVRRHAGGLVTTEDFVRALFDATGRNVEGLVEQWVRAGGYPIYAVSHEQRETTLALQVRQDQPLDELVPLFDMPIDVDLFYKDGEVRRHTIRVWRHDETFELPLEGELVDVVFDADCGVLSEIRQEKTTEMWVHQAGLDRDTALQWRALDALEERALASEAARGSLLRILRGGSEPLLRERAAQHCDFRDWRAWVSLVEAAVNDPATRVRRMAAHTLLQHSLRAQFEVGGAEYEYLLDHFSQETSPGVRQKLAELLGIEP